MPSPDAEPEEDSLDEEDLDDVEPSLDEDDEDEELSLALERELLELMELLELLELEELELDSSLSLVEEEYAEKGPLARPE